MPVRYSPDEPEYDDVTHWEVGLGVELYSTFSSPVRIASIEVIRYRDQDFVKSTSVDGVVWALPAPTVDPICGPRRCAAGTLGTWTGRYVRPGAAARGGGGVAEGWV